MLATIINIENNYKYKYNIKIINTVENSTTTKKVLVLSTPHRSSENN